MSLFLVYTIVEDMFKIVAEEDLQKINNKIERWIKLPENLLEFYVMKERGNNKFEIRLVTLKEYDNYVSASIIENQYDPEQLIVCTRKTNFSKFDVIEKKIISNTTELYHEFSIYHFYHL